MLSMPEVKSLVGVDKALSLVELAYCLLAQGKAMALPRSRVTLEKHQRVLLLQAGYAELPWGDFVNSKTSGGGSGIITLHDAKSNYPLAVMDPTYISGLRTGANGALSAKYMARKESKIIGVIGSGLQARSGLLALSKVFPAITLANIYSNTPEYRESCAEELSEMLDFPVIAADSVEQATRDADIIYMATRSKDPIIHTEHIRPGVHLSCIGSSVEVHLDVLLQSRVVVDSFKDPHTRSKTALGISKGKLTMDGIYAEMSEIVSGAKPGRTSDADITLLDSSGLAILDTVLAASVYQEALKTGTGTEVRISPRDKSEKYPYT
jgi:ornithine cyclodeaminase/alanine dehydrogenase-like protein (mu-crystallin family)